MLRRLFPVVALLLLPPAVRAQELPERLLPAGTHLYFRWDGVAGQQAAFDKTALAQIFEGDTGRLLTDLLTELKAKHLLALLRSVAREGVAVGVEVANLKAGDPPDVQLTAVFPNAKAQWDPLFGTMTWAADESGAGTKEIEVMKRTVYHLKDAPITVAWFKEGNDAVLVLSAAAPEDAVKRVLAQTPRLPGTALFKKVQGFKEFSTCGRGFIDLAALIKLIGNLDPAVPKVLDELGLNAFRDATFQYGFDGAAIHGLVMLDVPGPRKGLARLVGGKTFRLDDLPSLPADLAGFTALRVDMPALFDGSVELLKRVLPPNEAKEIDEGIKTANQALGINLRDDLIGEFGSMLVSCVAPPDGGLIFGQSLLVQVKDTAKFDKTLGKIMTALAALSQNALEMKQRKYRGVTLHTLVVNEREFFLTPTYTVHKGWLVLGMTPQPVQSYVLRAEGVLPGWKPGPAVQTALKKLPAEFSLLSVSDPAPVMKVILNGAPYLGQGIISTEGALRKRGLTMPLLPCADEFARHLFPGVSAATDDGKTWRMESRASFELPLGLLRPDHAAVAMMGFASMVALYVFR
jgi:hypothetical protein